MGSSCSSEAPFDHWSAIPAPSGNTQSIESFGVKIQTDNWNWDVDSHHLVSATHKKLDLERVSPYAKQPAKISTTLHQMDHNSDGQRDLETLIRHQHKIVMDGISTRMPNITPKTVTDAPIPPGATRGPFGWYVEVALYNKGGAASDKPTMTTFCYYGINGCLLMNLETTMLGELTNEIRADIAHLASSITFIPPAEIIPAPPAASIKPGPFSGFGFSTFALHGGRGTISVPAHWTWGTTDEALAIEKLDPSKTLAVLYAPRTRKAFVVGDPRDEAVAPEEPVCKIQNVAGTSVSLTRYKGGGRYLQHPSLPVSLRRDLEADELDETTLAQIVASISLTSVDAASFKTVFTAPVLGLSLTSPASGRFAVQENYFTTRNKPSLLFILDHFDTEAPAAMDRTVRFFAVKPDVDGNSDEAVAEEFNYVFRNLDPNTEITKFEIGDTPVLSYSVSRGDLTAKMVALSVGGTGNPKKVVCALVQCTSAAHKAENLLREIVPLVTTLV